jgi:hypothetical protein
MKVQAGPESTQGTIPAPPCIVDPTLIPRDPTLISRDPNVPEGAPTLADERSLRM